MFLCCVYDILGSLAVTVSIGLRALFFRTVATIGVVAAEVCSVLLSSAVTVSVADPTFDPAFAGAITVRDFANRTRITVAVVAAFTVVTTTIVVSSVTAVTATAVTAAFAVVNAVIAATVVASIPFVAV